MCIRDRKKLEEIITELEAGDLPLEKSIKAFEDGIKLTRHCQKLLTEAELKIEKLVDSDDGSFDLESFDDS